ncbi:MAG: zinc-ribbon domain-containing protein [Candidatus Odinarchaeota archaeon]|nr:zinc-ribbon domain-containing protein [Candidatus Odinarchaeota archaeon]
MYSKPKKYKGYVILNHQVYPAEEVIEAIQQQGVASFSFEGPILVIGNKRIHPLRFNHIEEIMKLTCYGSLAYCCSPDFECAIRDEVLRLLGLTKEEYAKLKAKHHVEFIEFSKNKANYLFDQKTSSSPIGLTNQEKQTSMPVSQFERSVNNVHSVSDLFDSFSITEKHRSNISGITKVHTRPAPTGFIYCPNCNALIPDGAITCPTCGYKLKRRRI